MGVAISQMRMSITQFVHVAAILSAAIAKSTSWRGIHYYIDGPWKIRMGQYSPYSVPSTIPGDESLDELVVILVPMHISLFFRLFGVFSLSSRSLAHQHTTRTCNE